MLWTAFTLGLFGSLHCLGMCGPIVLAIPVPDSSKYQVANRLLGYSFGRIITYMMLGSAVGLLGWGAALAGGQSFLSIAMGVFILTITLLQINVEFHLLRMPAVGRFFLWVKTTLGRYLNNQTSGFKLGIINGFLPCGLVYVAIIGAVTMGCVWKSALYMAFFGLGTFPLLFLAGFISKISVSKIRMRLTKWYPFFMLILGVLFILRGLNFLDLPADFNFMAPSGNMPSCH